MKVDDTWYVRPTGVPERIASGGVVVRREGTDLFVALTRERGLDEYVLPKGGVEQGESLIEAAHREVEEETGLSQLWLIKKLDVVERLTYNRRYWSMVHFYLFHTDQVEATPTDSRYHSGMGWFSLQELPPLFWPEQSDLLERYRESIVREIESRVLGG